MSAVEDLRASDCVRFSGISYHLSSILGESDRTSTPPCKTKVAGQLELTLTSEDFNIPIPGLTFPFTGVASGSTVTWTVDQSLDIWYSGAHITRVHGQIVTRVDEVAPMLGTNCAGAQRVVKSTLTTIGSNNTVTIDTSFGAAVASSITITAATCAQALEALFFNVRIRPNRSSNDGCGNHYQLVDSSVRFSASVENFAGDGDITSVQYNWMIPSTVTVHGPTDRRNVDVTLGVPGTTTISCRAIITTSLGVNATQTSSTTFAVLTVEEAQQLQLMCHLRTIARGTSSTVIRGIGAGFTVGGHRFVDPLWDPVPDGFVANVLTRGLTRFEVHEVRAAAEKLARAATALVKQSTIVIEHHEKQAKIETEVAMKAAATKPPGKH